MYTLAVVDMQKNFVRGSNELIIDNVELQIQQAILDKASIVFLEYSGYGKTIEKLTSITDRIKYTKVKHITKYSDDGGRELREVIHNNLYSKNIKVVGINTDACVYSTVAGYLSQAYDSNIEVITSACSSAWKDGHKNGIDKLINLSHDHINLKITLP